MKFTTFARLCFTSAFSLSASWLWQLLLKRCWRPKLVFMVYLGSKKYITRYIFRFLYDHFPIPDISPLGFIVRPGMIGVYATTKYPLAEVSKQQLAATTDGITKAFPYVRSVSLSGSWPSFLRKAGLSNSAPPLTDATLGTVYAMEKICEEMIQRRNKTTDKAKLCILGGGGFVGKALLPVIRDRYGAIVAIDPCYRETTSEDNVICTKDPKSIRGADAVLVLTPRGDDAIMYSTYAEVDQIWGDDTFPDMSPATQKSIRDKGALLFKTAMIDKTLRFIPSLPTFGINHVPGCLISAMVNEKKPGIQGISRFYEIADTLGLEPRLFPHGRQS